MTSSIVPGYSWLFGEPEFTYEQLLKDIPSSTVIAMAIMLNNELDTPLLYEQQQQRIYDAISYRFTPHQKEVVADAFSRFNNISPIQFSNDIFRREYFLKMIIIETNRQADFPLTDISPQQEFNFFLAFLLVIDEINKEDQALMTELRQYSTEPLAFYIRLWTPNLSKYQFNERSKPLFEMFKLACLANYSFSRWRSALKEYLEHFGLKSIGNLLHFYKVAFDAATTFQQDEVVTSLSYIKPAINLSIDPYAKQSLNQLIKPGCNVTVADFNIYPLYHNPERGYMVIDKNTLFKKIYRGPLFELHRTTALKSLHYQNYSGDVSKDVIENVCFKQVISKLCDGSEDKPHFDDTDDKKQGVPDAYFRQGNIVFLFEFKAYVMAERFFSKIETGKGLEVFRDFQKYLDKRLVNTKGIKQLENHVIAIRDGAIDFDPPLEELKQSGLIIYPIVCHDDFYFTMPGINTYLDDIFHQKINALGLLNYEVKNVTLVHLSNIFDLALRLSTIDVFRQLIDEYWATMQERKAVYLQNQAANDPVTYHRSFDELYDLHYRKDLPEIPIEADSTIKLFALAGVTQEIIDETV